MLDGAITDESDTLDKLREPALLALIDRITVVEDLAFTALQPRVVPNRLAFRTIDERSDLTGLLASLS